MERIMSQRDGLPCFQSLFHNKCRYSRPEEYRFWIIYFVDISRDILWIHKQKKCTKPQNNKVLCFPRKLNPLPKPVFEILHIQTAERCCVHIFLCRSKAKSDYWNIKGKLAGRNTCTVSLFLCSINTMVLPTASYYEFLLYVTCGRVQVVSKIFLLTANAFGIPYDVKV